MQSTTQAALDAAEITTTQAVAELLRRTLERAKASYDNDRLGEVEGDTPEAANDDAPSGVEHVAPDDWSATLTTNITVEAKHWTGKKRFGLSDIQALIVDPDTRENKDGRCYAAGTLVGDKRVATAVRQIDTLVYDVDGSALADIESRVDAAGIFAWLHTTHSHLSTETLIATNHVERWAKSRGVDYPLSRDDMQRYIDDPANRKTYLRNISYDPSPEALKHTTDGLMVVLGHDPCEKYRLIVPLAKPIVIGHLATSTQAAVAVYKAIYNGVAQTLGLDHDKKCEDPSRAYYFPSRRSGDVAYVAQEYGGSLADETVPLLDWTDETRWVRARHQDKSSKGGGSAKSAGNKTTGGGQRKSAKRQHLVTTPEGVTVDLMRLRADLDIESILRSAPDSSEIGDDRERGGFVMTCPNEHQHSKPGGRGCFAANASDDHPSWNLYCSHNGCADDDKFYRLAKLVEDGRVSVEDLGLEPGPSQNEDGTIGTPEAVTEHYIEQAGFAAGLKLKVDFDEGGNVYFFRPGGGQRQSGGGQNKPTIPVLLSSPLIVVGVGINASDGDSRPRLFLKAEQQDGSWRDVSFSWEEMSRSDFAQAIARIGISSADPTKLATVLRLVKTHHLIRCYDHGGMVSEGVYITPGAEVLKAPGNTLDVRATFKPVKGYGQHGDRERIDKVLRYCEPQTRIVAAVGLSLASAFMDVFNIEGGGFHLFADTSHGKTVTMRVAAAMWGIAKASGAGGIMMSANKTKQNPEVSASLLTDNLVMIDETQSGDPEVFHRIVYTIANHASRESVHGDGSAKDVRELRAMMLTTGEDDLREFFEANSLPYHGGMGVRVMGVYADAGKGFGIFDRLPSDFEKAADFAEWIKDETGQHCGYHGPELVRAYLADAEGFESDLRDAARAVRKAMEEIADTTHGDIARVVKRLSLIAGVTMVASRRGVLPWQESSVVTAFETLFRDWVGVRGTDGPVEGVYGLRDFENYIYQQPGAFDDVHRGPTAMGRNMVGLRGYVDARGDPFVPPADCFVEYWIPDYKALAVCTGGQLKRAKGLIKYLASGQAEGWQLIRDSDTHLGHRTKGRRGMRGRAYRIRSVIPIGADEVPEDFTEETKKAEIPASRPR